MAGLLANGGGSGKTSFGRAIWTGHSWAGFLCDEGREKGEAEVGGEGKIKRKGRMKAARQRKRQTGNDRDLVLMGTATSIQICETDAVDEEN